MIAHRSATVTLPLMAQTGPPAKSAVWSLMGGKRTSRGKPNSSFHRMVKLGIYAEDWAGDVSNDGGNFGERP